MAILQNVKTLLGLSSTDTEQDQKLAIIINTAEKRLMAYLPAGLTAVPTALDYIVQELAIARFNRLGNENMTAFTQEGESISFSEDDFAPYLKEITAWCTKQENAHEGVVRFL